MLDDVDRSVTAELPDAALIEIFRQWPSSSTVERLYDDAGDDWPPLSGELTEALSTGPTDAVLFNLNTIGDPWRSWKQANALTLSDRSVWLDLIKKHEQIDRLAVHAPAEGARRG